MNLDIYHLWIITKMVQSFNNDVKTLINFNNPSIAHNYIVKKQAMGTKISNGLHNRYQSDL